MTASEIIRKGLWLPFKIYLQPYGFREEVAALAPDLPERYSLWHARHKLRTDARFRQAFGATRRSRGRGARENRADQSPRCRPAWP